MHGTAELRNQRIVSNYGLGEHSGVDQVDRLLREYGRQETPLSPDPSEIPGIKGSLFYELYEDEENRVVLETWSENPTTRALGNLLADYFTGLRPEDATVEPWFWDEALLDSIGEVHYNPVIELEKECLVWVREVAQEKVHQVQEQPNRGMRVA